MKMKYHTKFLVLSLLLPVICYLSSSLLYAAGASDETPYNPPSSSPIMTGAPQPFNAINNPNSVLQRPPIRPPRPANDTTRPMPESGRPNIPAPGGERGSAPALVPSVPQVVTGTGQNYGTITLRVDPLMIRTQVGDIVQQNIIIDNPRGVAIDEVEIVLKYSTKNLEVLDSDSTLPGINIKSLINSQKNPGLEVVLNQVDTTKGQIHFIVKSLSSNSYIGGKLATISWKANKAIYYTPITFAFPADFKSPGTKVRRQGRDLLGTELGGSEGVITGGIAISPAPAIKTSGELQ